MTEQVRVVDETDEERASRLGDAPWLFLIIGFVVGLAFAVLYLNPTTAPPTAVTVADGISPPTSPPDTAAEPEEEPLALGDTIEGFPDAMVAVVQGEGRNLIHLLWPLEAGPVRRSLPGGDFGEVRFDSSARWMAMTTRVPDAEGVLLSMGTVSSMEPVASAVTSLAWHDFKSGALAFTRSENGIVTLSVVRADRNPEDILTGLSPETTIAAWGDWGFVLHKPELDGISLHDPTGELRASSPGRAYSSHPLGWIVGVDENLILMSAGGATRELEIDLARVGTVLDARLSPDADLVAVRGTRAVAVVSVSDSELRRFVPLRGDRGRLAWSSDSRFVVLPGTRGVVVIEVMSESPTVTLLPKSLLNEVGLVPLAGSASLSRRG